jgi:hypothetical protein
MKSKAHWLSSVMSPPHSWGNQIEWKHPQESYSAIRYHLLPTRGEIRLNGNTSVGASTQQQFVYSPYTGKSDRKLISDRVMTQHNSSPSSRPKSFNEFDIFLFLMGLLSILGGYGIQELNQYKEKNFLKTTGKVIEHVNMPSQQVPGDYRSREQHVYKIEFTAKNRLFNFVDSYSSGGVDYIGVDPDGTVDVLYDPKNPTVAAEVYRPLGAVRSWYLYLGGGILILFSIGKPPALAD